MKCITTRPKDLINIVACHKSAFPGALSSKMGNAFILKMMEWYIESDRGILFHLENENNEIIGSINPSKIINTVFGGRKNNS